MNTDKALVETQGEKITITADDVRRYLCPKASNQEVAIFLRTCQSMQLNPFSREVYLVKYDERQPAATVVAIDAYLRAGESNDKYDGHEAGIILKDTTGKLEYREGPSPCRRKRTKADWWVDGQGSTARTGRSPSTPR